MMKVTSICFVLSMALFLGCSDKSYVYQGDEALISAVGKENGSTTAGNLITSAIRQTHDLDVVLYPSELLKKKSFAFLAKDMNQFDKEQLLNMYPKGIKDQFMLGAMRGSDIKSFIRDRARERYVTDLQVAGIRYHLHYVGGMPGVLQFQKSDVGELKDDKVYRVAVSQFYFFSGQTFPSYKYRSGLNFAFTKEGKIVSARESLSQYLEEQNPLIGIHERRAKVSRSQRGSAGKKRIPEIQGRSHRSPLYGMEVETTGVVTAIGSQDWYPGGTHLYIQDLKGDGDPKTSDGLHVYLDNPDMAYLKESEASFLDKKEGIDESRRLTLGDKIRVRGVVYEQLADNGLGKTSLREVSKLEALSGDNFLPDPVHLGEGGRPLPRGPISTYRGNLNLKKGLNLNEGIDFWESLEGMRISIDNPRILDFRGGKAEYEDDDAKGYLNLYVLPDGHKRVIGTTRAGGLMIDERDEDFNPEILQLSANYLSRGIDTETIYRVGDMINGNLEGVLSYEKNIFGGGEYAMVLPKEQEALEKLSSRLSDEREGNIPDHTERPQTTLSSDGKSLTIATYNVKNLAGHQKKRIRATGKVISKNLKCPDILNLVEIQDDNGTDFSGGASAEKTLKRLVATIDCPGVDYKWINIDPVVHDEGGQPGGNIRVVFLYNARKVSFSSRPAPGSLSRTLINDRGSLENNPGRVLPNEDIFEGTRRSLVAEFHYRGEQIFVIGNHFNSKLGDSSRWAADQPFNPGSELERTQIADKINNYVEYLEHKRPGAHIAVLGDFNAYPGENSMDVLAGKELTNLMTHKNLVPRQNRYTTTYNGNSQALDYIFANRNFLKRNPKLEVLHINSDFMGRFSDHDPVISKFYFD